MSERMCEATSKQGTVAVDIESSSDDGIEGTTGAEFKQRPSCLRSKERRESPHSKRVSFGADEKGDAEILVQPNANKETQDAYGQYCGIPAQQRYGFLSKEKRRKRGV